MVGRNNGLGRFKWLGRNTMNGDSDLLEHFNSNHSLRALQIKL
jgi:hypothetical protein